jgi:hypothetical protein
MSQGTEGTTPTFFGLRSHRTCKFGRMVFVGKDVTAEDLFDKLLDSGRKIEAHDQTLTSLAMYVEQMASFKIGNIVAILPTNSAFGFELVKVAEMAKTQVRPLP